MMFSEINYDTVPVGYMADGLRRYIEHGYEPGGFMRAVLCNDLQEAVLRADGINVSKLPHWVIWVRDNLPGGCKGSYEAYNAWVEIGGLQGIAKG